MAAFEKVKSGMPGLDSVLDYIRLVDNVVWQVTDLEEYRYFVIPFVRQALEDKRNLIYIRFAQHERILPEMDGVKTYQFDPDEGFEKFTVSIHNVITKEGRDAFYIFDSLSELQSAWYTDLMMGNFFCVTCPYLFTLDTVAFFPLIRGRHSFEAVARIRETTQLLLDVYSDGEVRYVHPLKVWNRYSATMFLPHCCKDEREGFVPLVDGIATSRYYSLIQTSSGYHQHSEQHDSFYIGSDVFYTYIVSNGCWEIRIRQKTEQGFLEAAEELRQGLLKGRFPNNIREKFRNMLEYFGQNPIIVRSSSLLEDGFGNAFAGKYESVFCPNRGEIEERLEYFENAVRIVYASTMDASALEYRKTRGLADCDEQMAILVQRVSGSYYGPYFMPCTAGVGYSYSAYKWMPDMDPAAGMLRLVMGLGTKAVDRTENDYPRLVNLDRPEVTMLVQVADKHRFSQHKIDVINMAENKFEEVALEKLLPYLPQWYKSTVLEHDYEAEDKLREMGRYRDIYFVSCQRMLANRKFTKMMKELLHELQKAYGNPVDIEYTVNLSKGEDFVVNLLQCRPLYVGKGDEGMDIPERKEEDTFFEITESSMGQSQETDIDVIVQIEPKEYYEFPYIRKQEVADVIGKINAFYKNTGKKLLLTVPGRIGTSSPELGVPVRFADISGFCGICEVSDNRAGYMPELSYGSHMFQDLVEAEIFYGAIFGDRRTKCYHRDFFVGQKNLFSEICPDKGELSHIVRVYETAGITLWVDGVNNHALCARK